MGFGWCKTPDAGSVPMQRPTLRRGHGHRRVQYRPAGCRRPGRSLDGAALDDSAGQDAAALHIKPCAVVAAARASFLNVGEAYYPVLFTAAD